MPHDALTPRRYQALEGLHDHIVSAGRPPTLEELGRRLGGLHRSTVHTLCQALTQAGYLVRKPGTSPRRYRLTGRGQSVLTERRMGAKASQPLPPESERTGLL